METRPAPKAANSRSSTGSPGSKNYPATGGFDSLLRGLVSEHYREVDALRAQVAKLQRFCVDNVQSSGAEVKGDHPSQNAFAFSSMASSGPIDSAEERPSVLSSGSVEQEATITIPDEDAMLAALNLASDLKNEVAVRNGSRVQDTPRLEHKTPGFKLRDSWQIARNAEKPFSGDIRTAPNQGDIDDPEGEAGLPVTPCEQAALEVQFAAEASMVDRASLVTLPDDLPAKFGTNPCPAMASQSSVNFGARNLESWGRIIKAVKMNQTVAALPKVSVVWRDAWEQHQAREAKNAGVLQFDVLIAKAAQANFESKGTEDLARLEKQQTMGQAGLAFKDKFMINVCDFCMTSTMHPTCKKRVSWDMIGILLLIHDLVFIPMQVYTKPATDGFPHQYTNFQEVLDYGGACFWTIDVFVSFRTGYYSAEGFVEVRPSKIARNYLKSWFAMDMLIVSADWSSMFLGMSSASGYMRLGKTVSRFMRVLRLLRFLKMNKALQDCMERINSEYLLQVIGIFKTLLMIVVINHYVACAWFGLGSAGFMSERWTDKFLTNYPTSFAYAYATSLHWSLTQFTPASMEVVPQNAFERAFVIVVIIMALVAFSSFVSSITAAMTHIRTINAQKMQLEAKVRQFFSEQKISHQMASRVWHFLRNNNIGAGRRLKEQDIPAFKSLPPKVKEDLRLEVFLPILTMHPFLAEFARKEARSMLKIVNMALSEKSFIVGEEVYGPQDVVDHMVYVTLGTLEYLTTGEVTDNSKPQSRTTRSRRTKRDSDERAFDNRHFVMTGQWACEVCLWADKAQLDGPLMAIGGLAEVILLGAAAFQRIALEEGDSVPFVIKYAEIFMDHFTEVARVACVEEIDQFYESDLLFNDPERMQAIVDGANEALLPESASGARLYDSIISTASFMGSIASKSAKRGSKRTNTGGSIGSMDSNGVMASRSSQKSCDTLDSGPRNTFEKNME